MENIPNTPNVSKQEEAPATATVAENSNAIPYRTGRIAIVGRPNVGKSTLLNALVGQHLSITSKKPQTTRSTILGVVTKPEAQYVFVDTPGLSRKHGHALARRMNTSVSNAIKGVDVVVLVIESKGWTPADEALLNILPKAGISVVLVLNKIDLMTQRDQLLPLMASSAQRYPFCAIVPTSAEKELQVQDVFKAVYNFLPEGDAMFEEDDLTDRSMRYLAGETIREKAFRLLGDEVPFGLAVSIDAWEEDDRLIRIAASIWVERESHRGIVIGKAGAKLREIGRLARQDIAQMSEKSVFMETLVKVKRGWYDDSQALRSLGYD